jgi:hypothetical protein
LRADAGEFLGREMFDCAGEVGVVENREAIGLEHVGAEFGEGAVGSDADGAAHGFAAVFGDLVLDGFGECFAGCTRVLGAVEFATDFVDGVDTIDGDVFVDSREDAVMHAHVEARAGVDDGDSGAEAFGVAHARAGLDAFGFCFVACGDAAAAVAGDGRDGDRFAAESGLDVLLNGGEVGVEIEEERAQRHACETVRWGYEASAAKWCGDGYAGQFSGWCSDGGR